jgi:hypothetical protein
MTLQDTLSHDLPGLWGALLGFLSGVIINCDSLQSATAFITKGVSRTPRTYGVWQYMQVINPHKVWLVRQGPRDGIQDIRSTIIVGD